MVAERLLFDGVMTDRAFLLTLRDALRAGLTPAGHLAQKVTSERLGYCGWRAESDRCVEYRRLLADLDAVLEG